MAESQVLDQGLSTFQNDVVIEENPPPDAFEFTDALGVTPGESVDRPMWNGFSESEIRQMPQEEYLDFLTSIQTDFHPEEVARNAGLLHDRFAAELEKYAQGPLKEKYQADMIAADTRMILWRIAGAEEVFVEPEVLDQWYDDIFSKNHMLRHHAIEALHIVLVLDSKNEQRGEGLDLRDEFYSGLHELLIHAQTPEDHKLAADMIDVVWSSLPRQDLEILLLNAVEDAKTPESLRFIVGTIGDRIGLEKTLTILRAYANVEPDFQTDLGRVEEAIGFHQAEIDLKTLYEKINFEDYKPNEELNEYELDFITKEAAGKKGILDIGCGTGRLLLGLHARGRTDIAGIDFVPRHVEYIHDVDPEVDVQEASWYALPFADKSFEVAYCMGRSFLHNTAVRDGLAFLHEAKRVLKDDGILLIDLPDPDVGQYAKVRDQYASIAEGLGVTYYENGSLRDSPNGENFFDRLAPGMEQFSAMALLVGLDAQIVQEREYTDTEGEKNRNLYWKLTKRKKPLSTQEMQRAMFRSRTGAPSLKVEWL